MNGGPAFQSKQRNIGIDLFRAAFALWVLFAHLLPWAMISGQTGVFLESLNAFWRFFAVSLQSFGALNPAVLGFVVLSGYCIHRSGIGDGVSGLRGYFLKRFFRIVPLMLIAASCGMILLFSHGGNDIVFRLTGSQAFSAWASFVKVTGLTAFYPYQYPQVFQGNAPLGTVLVEIWLYVVYPVFLLFLCRSGMVTLSAAIFGLFLFGLLIAWLNGQPGWFQNASIYKFLPYWWIGAYFVTLSDNKLFGKTIVACFAIYLLAYLADYKSVVFVEIMHLGLALFFGFLFRSMEDRAFTSWPSRVISFIGKSGYSLYALHAPIVIYLLFFGVNWLLILAICVAVSTLVYFLVEEPANRFGRRLANRKTGLARPDQQPAE